MQPIYLIAGDDADAAIHARMLQLTAMENGFSLLHLPRQKEPPEGSLLLVDLDSIPKEQATDLCRRFSTVVYSRGKRAAPEEAFALLERPVPNAVFLATLQRLTEQTEPTPQAESLPLAYTEGRVTSPADGLAFASDRTVTFRGEPITLTAREYDLLRYLYDHRSKAVSRAELLHEVWGFRYFGETNVVDVYIRYLREKLDEPFGVRMITTVRGCGYRLQ